MVNQNSASIQLYLPLKHTSPIPLDGPEYPYYKDSVQDIPVSRLVGAELIVLNNIIVPIIPTDNRQQVLVAAAKGITYPFECKRKTSSVSTHICS